MTRPRGQSLEGLRDQILHTWLDRSALGHRPARVESALSVQTKPSRSISRPIGRYRRGEQPSHAAWQRNRNPRMHLLRRRPRHGRGALAPLGALGGAHSEGRHARRRQTAAALARRLPDLTPAAQGPLGMSLSQEESKPLPCGTPPLRPAGRQPAAPGGHPAQRLAIAGEHARERARHALPEH